MKNSNYFKSLRRALSVLKCFTPQEIELTGAEIARKVGTHRTTSYRILSALVEEGLIDRNDKTGKYSIGPALYALGSLYLSTTDVFRTAKPVFETLNNLTTEVVSMGILDRGNMVFVMKEEAKHPVRFYHRIGTIFPAYSTAMGRALLSELTDAEIDCLYPDEKLRPVTPKTIKTKTELKIKLGKIRETGISYDSEGSIEGLEGIAALIRDDRGRAVAAMSFSIPIFRMNPIRHEEFTSLIKMGASLISYRLGYQNSENPVHDIREIISWSENNQQVLAVDTVNQP